MYSSICFNIDSTDLYTEHVLVEWDYVPILFVCKNDTQRYLVLCADPEHDQYYIVKIAKNDLLNLLHGKLPFRDAFLNQSYYWDVLTSEKVCDDIVTKKPIKDIKTAWLPHEGATFKILTNDVEQYAQMLEAET